MALFLAARIAIKITQWGGGKTNYVGVPGLQKLEIAAGKRAYIPAAPATSESSYTSFR